jgi:hypothetical protein
MGCNCKKKNQIVNHEDSRDHITLIENTLSEIFSVSDRETLTDLDKIQLVSVYESVYPNSKGKPNPIDIINILEEVLNKFKTRRR